jgi:hypothetical protein
MHTSVIAYKSLNHLSKILGVLQFVNQAGTTSFSFTKFQNGMQRKPYSVNTPKRRVL